MEKILVIGSCGQIGSELVPALRNKYGGENVFPTGVTTPPCESVCESGSYYHLDVLDKNGFQKMVYENQINIIINLASLLSAVGEKMPSKTWDININGLLNTLEIGRQYKIEKILWPSSIGVFGPSTPRENTPNETILHPTTMYGITKLSGELLLDYYHRKYGLDTRSMRLPGIISSEAPPGGGTTDYAVEIFYEALKNNRYTCFLREDTVLPMMYMPDCIKCFIDLLEADASKLRRRVYNVTSMSFSAGKLANEIKKYLPDFKITYEPDVRQEIADSWTKSMDDSLARQEWKWSPEYNLESMTKDMLEKLRKRLF